MRKTIKYTLSLLTATTMLAGCTSAPPAESPAASQALQSIPPKVEGPTNVYYEVFVRSFADSNGDGIGDLNGLTDKLDYLDRLGIDGLWLMPIQPSPSYHGYDVTDYYGINPDYGTMDDFKRLIAEAHKRGIRILMDLVVNHTSVEHPWFVDSAKGKDSPYRDWYTWVDDAEKATPSDGATGNAAWHPASSGHYIGVFWGGMPDLNFDNPEVRHEMISIGRHWLKEGVDGFRLDAAKHIYGDFKTTVSTKPIQDNNKAWWQEFREGISTVKPDAYLVGEVYDNTAIVAPYLDHAFDSAFNFDLANSLISDASAETASSIGFTLSRIHEFYSKTSGGKFIDAPFLSNHDQNRVMSALGNNVDLAKIAASLLLTMPGNPFIYYGEELGMSGVKPDERIREPFPWTREEGGVEETTWEDSMYRDKEVSVEAQEESPGSLLNHYRTLISWRAQEKTLREGTIVSYDTDHSFVTSYIRSSGEEQVLVLHNMSKDPQTLTLEATKAQPAVFAKLAHANNAGAKLDKQRLDLPPYTTVVLKP